MLVAGRGEFVSRIVGVVSLTNARIEQAMCWVTLAGARAGKPPGHRLGENKREFARCWEASAI